MALRPLISILHFGIVFFRISNSLSDSKKTKGFTFLKEHDGSITGIEDGFQQIKLAGILHIYGIVNMRLYNHNELLLSSFN